VTVVTDKTVQYEQYQESLLAEKKDLDEKLARLVNFIGSTTFQQLPNNYCDLLQDQQIAMEEYARILAARIDLFTSDYAPKAETGGPEAPEPAPKAEEPEPKGKKKHDKDNDWKE
jgi:hypothetical protein